MRVLLVNDYLEAGGCEHVVQRTATGLRERGHEVEVFTSQDVGGRRTPWGYVDSKGARLALRRRLDALTPDVVHFFNVYHELSPGVIAEAHAWRGGRMTRLVMTAADFHLVCPNSGLRRFEGEAPVMLEPGVRVRGRDLWRWRWDHRSRAHGLLKAAQHSWNYRVHRRWRAIDVLICASRFMMRAMAVTGIPRVHLPDPGPEVAEAAGKEPGRDLRLIFAGRVEPEKGLGLFLSAITRIEGWHLTVVGDGSSLGGVKRFVRENRLEERVEFCGRLSHAGTLERIGQADVLVLPSLVYENAPLVMLEALSRGTGLLVSDRGGMAEIVAEFGVGWTFNPLMAESVEAGLGRALSQEPTGVGPSDRVAEMLESRGLRNYVRRLESLYTDGERGSACAC